MVNLWLRNEFYSFLYRNGSSEYGKKFYCKDRLIYIRIFVFLIIVFMSRFNRVVFCLLIA